jgi:hypothetical protein
VQTNNLVANGETRAPHLMSARKQVSSALDLNRRHSVQQIKQEEEEEEEEEGPSRQSTPRQTVKVPN